MSTNFVTALLLRLYVFLLLSLKNLMHGNGYHVPYSIEISSAALNSFVKDEFLAHVK